MAGRRDKPFDDGFLLSEGVRMYCTELVLKALASVGVGFAGSMPHIRVMLIAEPVAMPDALRRLPQMKAIVSDPAVLAAAAR